MNELPLPQDEQGHVYLAAEVFDLCISTVSKTSLKSRLEGVRCSVESAASNYDDYAEAAELHLMDQSKNVGTVTKVELQRVYDRMLQARNPGRAVYDRIRSGAVNESCPLCGLGHVKTLDHHLPQSRYTLLAVTPNNLVPSCRDCQSEKESDYPKSEATQTLHPYFDRFQSAVWLKAEVVAGQSAAFRFFVDEEAQFEPIDIERLKHHLKTFDLAARFAVQAANELQNMRPSLKRLYDLGGAAAVRVDIADRAASSESIIRNSWRSAMKRAASESDWFCDGGFNQT